MSSWASKSVRRLALRWDSIAFICFCRASFSSNVSAAVAARRASLIWRLISLTSPSQAQFQVISPAVQFIGLSFEELCVAFRDGSLSLPDPGEFEFEFIDHITVRHGRFDSCYIRRT